MGESLHGPQEFSNAVDPGGEVWYSFQMKKVVVFSRKHDLGNGRILNRMNRDIRHKEPFGLFLSDCLSNVFHQRGNFC